MCMFRIFGGKGRVFLALYFLGADKINFLLENLFAKL